MKFLKLLPKIMFLLTFSTVSVFASTKSGSKQAITVDELGEQLKSKAKVSIPVVPPAPPIELNLCRKIEDEVSARYFSRQNTVITFQGEELHRPTFFDSNLYHLSRVENLLNIHRVAFGNTALRRNHLIANGYVSVYDTTDETRKIIEGTLHARKVEDAGAQGGTSEIEGMMRPNNAGVVGFEPANFISSSYNSPTVGREGCLPLAQTDVRPLSDSDNHGDRLALDTFKNNMDLFFGLIRRTAHREDLQIISMGTRYFSSYDACDNCHTRLYAGNQDMRGPLTHYAKRKNYAFFEDEEFNAEDNIPFSTFFYASRPYVVAGASYHVERNDNTTSPIAIKIHGTYNFPNVPYRYERASILAASLDNSIVRLSNTVINRGDNDRSIWTYIDKLRDSAVDAVF